MAVKANFGWATVLPAVVAAAAVLGGAIGPARADIYTKIQTAATGTTGLITFPWRAGSLAVADFNGDGEIDAAAAGTYIAGVVIVFGGGGQTWISTDSWPIALAAGDFNGDGAVDLAVAEQDAGGIAILTNDGTGTFTRAGFVATGDGESSPAPSAVVAVDLNKDGKTDLVVANRACDTVTVLRNTGSGFVVQQTLMVTGEPNALAVADLDGDGWPDVAVACATEDAVKVLKNSHGILSVAGSFEAGPYPEAVAAADLDGDGRIDLAAADHEGPQVTLLVNDGDFQFTSQAVQLSDPGKAFDPPVDVQLVDMNLDGRVDIRCSGLVLLNKGGLSYAVCSTDAWYGAVYSQGFARSDPVAFVGAAYNATRGLDDMMAVSHPHPVPIVGDINHDMHVDVIDLLLLIDAFDTATGDAAFDPGCDFNGDGTVDVVDLLYVIEAFGV